MGVFSEITRTNGKLFLHFFIILGGGRKVGAGRVKERWKEREKRCREGGNG